MQLETNKDFAQLPAIAVGDIVHLRWTDGFAYVVKAVVLQVNQDQIDAVVEAIFDGAGQGQVTAGDPLRLVGSTLSFAPRVVHKVIASRGAV